MGYASLPATMQDLIMVNFEFFGKIVLIGILVILSYLYITKFHKQIKTPYLSIGMLKLTFYLSSWLLLLLSPLFIMILDPSITLWDFFSIFLVIYAVVFFMSGLMVVINVFYYAPLFMVHLVGIDTGREDETKIINKLEKKIFGKKITNFWKRSIV